MIYFITKQTQLFEYSDKIKVLNDLNTLIDWCQNKDRVQFDVETSGLDFNDKLLLVQLGDYENQFVIDTQSIDIIEIKHIFETKLLIGHNLKFDLRFLYKLGIFPNSIIDTYIQECIINRGKILPKGYRGLQNVLERYLYVKLEDKSIRTDIERMGNTEQVIIYSAMDVKYLELINDKQKYVIKNEELEVYTQLENEFVLSLAYTMFCGIKLDVNKWNIRTTKFKKLVVQNLETLNKFISNKSKFFNRQIDMFTNDTSLKLNWSSEKQVKEFFEEQGLVPKDKDGKLTIEEPTLIKYAKDFEIVTPFIEYQGNKKQLSTYGDSFLSNINKHTGRIHSEYHQIQDTGRMSSASPNLQNIPADPDTRSCFVSEEGWDFIVADYSGQEQVILANFCKDKALIKFYEGGNNDMHSYVASKMYPELEGVSLDDVKKLHKDKRQIAKSAGFAINYGGSGVTIADNTGISREQGNIVYEAYMNAFIGLKVYFDKCKKEVLKRGYIITNNYTKARTYIHQFKYYQELQAEVSEVGFWEKRRTDATFKENNKKLVREWAITKSSIERMSLNFPIQGTAADMTKLGMIFFFREIKKLNLISSIKFVNIVHDEVDLEVKEEYSQQVADLLQKCLEEAGSRFCDIIPIKAEVEISKYWKK